MCDDTNGNTVCQLIMCWVIYRENRASAAVELEHLYHTMLADTFVFMFNLLH